MADEEEAIEALPSLLPTSAEARDELLKDERSLRELCEEYHTRFAGQRNVIGVRVAGRVVADIHRELCLPVPSDEALYSAMMQYNCGNAFTLGHEDFVAFVATVLCQCIRGMSLGEEDSSATEEDRNMDTVELQPPTSVGLITVHVHKLDGNSAAITISDSEVTETLHESVEAHLGVPKAHQRLLLGTSTLELTRPLFEQGVLEGASITVVRCKPQATLLRIRRVNLGDTSVPCRRSVTEEAAAAPHSLSFPTKFNPRDMVRSHSAAKLAPKRTELGPLGLPPCKHDRHRTSDVRIRRVNLGRA